MVAAYDKVGGNHIAVFEAPEDQTHQYGIVGRGAAISDHAFEVTEMVEKPKKGTAPSNLAVSGRYILQPEIFALLETQERGAGGEIQLTDSMLTLAKSQKFYGSIFKGRIFDCGMKIGFLTANIAYALQRPGLGDELRAELKGMV
jgi:UTP--glucose-1-phosphate uridylyltransferase